MITGNITEKFKEDVKRGTALANKAVKTAKGGKKEFVQPTHTVQTSEGITSMPKQIHEAFKKEWSGKALRLQRQNTQRNEFQDKYAEYMPQVPYNGGDTSFQ